MKIRTLGVVVVGSMSIAAYAAQKVEPGTLASARAKLAALGIGQTQLFANPRLALGAHSKPDKDEFGYGTQIKIGETTKMVRDIGPAKQELLDTAMGRADKMPSTFVPQTLVVIAEEETLAVPLTKSHITKKARMPRAAQKARKDLERTTVVHNKKDIEATTIVNLAGSDDLDVEGLLTMEVEPQPLSEEQSRKLLTLDFVHHEEMEKKDWQINPRRS
ncbi:MAG: hypothetical protein ACHQVS_00945 [Candidatus Babeliales bacterium]